MPGVSFLGSGYIMVVFCGMNARTLPERTGPPATPHTPIHRPPAPLNCSSAASVGRSYHLWGASTASGSQSPPQGGFRCDLVPGVFCVPKKAAGSLRFIVSCRAINSALDMTSLPRCHLPSYSEILATVHGVSLVMQFDFKSFFFQFGLPMDVRPLP